MRVVLIKYYTSDMYAFNVIIRAVPNVKECPGNPVEELIVPFRSVYPIRKEVYPSRYVHSGTIRFGV